MNRIVAICRNCPLWLPNNATNFEQCWAGWLLSPVYHSIFSFLSIRHEKNNECKAKSILFAKLCSDDVSINVKPVCCIVLFCYILHPVSLLSYQTVSKLSCWVGMWRIREAAKSIINQLHGRNGSGNWIRIE